MAANRKNANTGGKSSLEKKISKRGKSETLQAAAELGKEKEGFGEAGQDVGNGSKTAGAKATELGERVIEKVKKGLAQAYTAGAKVVDELSHTAQEYAEKYKAESEVRKLTGETDELLAQLGHSIFKRYLARGKVSESLFNEKEIVDQFNQIEKIDKRIIKIGKQLDKGKRTASKQQK